MKNAMSGVLDLIKTLLQGALDGLALLIKGMAGAFLEAGKALFTAVWDGIKGVWADISDWVTEKVNWLKDKLSFWNSANAQMTTSRMPAVTSPASTNANGLAYVPYDGYIAQLHKGERVLTAEENSNFASQILNSINTAINSKQSSNPINLSINLDGKVIARQIYDPLQTESAIRGKTLAVGV